MGGGTSRGPTIDAARARTFGTPARLSALHDPDTGRYFMPNVEPRDRAATLRPPDQYAPLFAIIDTGVLSAHPLLKPHLTAEQDFTGEGAEDHDGHGTMVAITLVLDAPNARILSAKVLANDDATVGVQARRIADGIRWAVETGASGINISVGFITPCGPEHRSLCESVREALNREVFIFVAGEAVCPAQCDPRTRVAGELEKDGNVQSGVPPWVVVENWGEVDHIPWEQWANN